MRCWGAVSWFTSPGPPRPAGEPGGREARSRLTADGQHPSALGLLSLTHGASFAMVGLSTVDPLSIEQRFPEEGEGQGHAATGRLSDEPFERPWAKEVTCGQLSASCHHNRRGHPPSSPRTLDPGAGAPSGLDLHRGSVGEPPHNAPDSWGHSILRTWCWRTAESRTNLISP